MNIAIIGCGNIGSGIAKRLVNCSSYLYDRDFEWTKELEREGFGIACRTIEDAIHPAEYIFLSVKPQNLYEVAEIMKPHLKSHQILVSALAGVTIATLEKHFPTCQVVRMMPNLALLYGNGLTGLVEDARISADNKEQLNVLLKPLGSTYWLPESKIDGLTALTGSGPAFVCVLIESMIEAGIAMGFNAKDSRALVLQMIEGTLTLLKETGSHPAEIKQQICSPGGTTIAGLIAMDKAAVRGHVIEAFLAAYRRSKELSK